MKLRLLAPFALLVTLAIPFSVASQVVTQSPASANSGVCDGNPNTEPHLYSGYAYSVAYQVIGGLAQITSQPVQTCYDFIHGAAAYSSTWEMVNGSNACYCDYMQAGYFETFGYPIVPVSQQDSSGGGVLSRYQAALPVGNANSFFQLYVPPGTGTTGCAAGCLQSYVNYSMYQQTNYNPFSVGAWAEPIDQYFSGEVDDTNSDIMGMTTTPVALFDLAWEGLDGSWHGGLVGPMYGPTYDISNDNRAFQTTPAFSTSFGTAFNNGCAYQC